MPVEHLKSRSTNPEGSCGCSTGTGLGSCSPGIGSSSTNTSGISERGSKFPFPCWSNLLNKSPFASVASLLHCFQVPAGSAQAKQVVLVKNWQCPSGRSEAEPDLIPGGNVSVWDLLTLPCSRKPQHGVIPLSSLLLFLFLCAELPWSAGNVPTQQNNQVCVSPKSHGVDLFWGEGSPTSQPGFHPKSWGEFGPGDLDSVISDVFFNINDSMMSLPVIKQEPHVEKSRIKSRRCLSRQRDKSPFHTYSS